jgi:sarcosine oxidase subunit beta
MGYIKAANRQEATTFTGVEVTSVEGYYVCAGFSGHGFMHGPVAGKIMSEIILDGHASIVDVSALDLSRFEGGLLIKE